MGLFKGRNKEKLKGIGNLLLKKGLPLLATAITGGAGGTVLSLVTDVLGLKDKDTDALEMELKNNPDAIIKLKEMENSNREELQRLALEMARVNMQHDQAYLDDKSSARNREIELVKVTGQRDAHLYVLAWTVVAAFFILTAILIYHPLNEEADGYINQLFGAMATGFGLVLSYFFGSSRGSANKQAMMHQQAMNKLEEDAFQNAKG